MMPEMKLVSSIKTKKFVCLHNASSRYKCKQTNLLVFNVSEEMLIVDVDCKWEKVVVPAL